MFSSTLTAAGTSNIVIEGSNQTIVLVVAAISALALVMALVFRREVLAFGEGTEKMQEIAKAVQEGAAAYLSRQFKTLAVFVALVFGLLFVLP